MIRFRALLAAIAMTAIVVSVSAQQPAQPGAPQPAGSPPSDPQSPTPPATAAPPARPVPGTVTCPAPPPPATLPTRMFNAPVGIVIVPVMSTKVADFEKFLGYVREALAESSDETVRRQAKGWQFYKVAETGPNNDVLFAFILNPAVPCVDYGLNQILAAAIPDAAKLKEVWSLYTGSVRTGGTLMNLVPLGAAPADGSPRPSDNSTPAPATPPLDANPVKPPGN